MLAPISNVIRMLHGDNPSPTMPQRMVGMRQIAVFSVIGGGCEWKKVV
jgi:hypothetical protein